jgi:hypothetical protein
MKVMEYLQYLQHPQYPHYPHHPQHPEEEEGEEGEYGLEHLEDLTLTPPRRTPSTIQLLCPFTNMLESTTISLLHFTLHDPRRYTRFCFPHFLTLYSGLVCCYACITLGEGWDSWTEHRWIWDGAAHSSMNLDLPYACRRDNEVGMMDGGDGVCVYRDNALWNYKHSI